MILTNLQEHVKEARQNYEQWQAEGRARGYSRSQPFEEENLVWAIEEYISHKGEFSEEDIIFLKSLGFAPEQFQEDDIYEVQILSLFGEILYCETFYNFQEAKECYNTSVHNGEIVELIEVDADRLKKDFGIYFCNFVIEKGKCIVQDKEVLIP